MDSEILVDVNSQNQPSYDLNDLSKEELIEKCNKFLTVAKKAKKSKDEILRENEIMKQELKDLRSANYDLELENQILKRDKFYPNGKHEDDNLLSELPILRHSHDDEIKRSNCFWRFSSFFKR